MSAIAAIGAGPGLGQAVARRSDQEGFSVALVSRAQADVDELAQELSAEGIAGRGYTANLRDPQALRSALAGRIWSLHADRGPFRTFVGE